ncbi:hypothetical protein [Pseudanabaena sp. FACHB-2040]|uniref:hypothetical protein n=1 Tax=Pseudanabaena sp. FACHB-2040 TaxID=2692859 RepID=UPI0016827CCA|nr:hypothetical protein [Pseudanabaena sp. FACHB-2040]MBD2261410.1 hypothetical protein [Pseudanabaena sp. FACHB-2040]
MPIKLIKISYNPRLKSVVDAAIHLLNVTLYGRCEVSIQHFESEQELETFLLNGADGPEQEHEIPTFTCPECHRTSYNPNDVLNSYCGACNRFFEESNVDG